jgi:hypothetical protein
MVQHYEWICCPHTSRPEVVLTVSLLWPSVSMPGQGSQRFEWGIRDAVTVEGLHQFVGDRVEAAWKSI